MILFFTKVNLKLVKDIKLKFEKLKLLLENILKYRRR